MRRNANPEVQPHDKDLVSDKTDKQMEVKSRSSRNANPEVQPHDKQMERSTDKLDGK